MDESLHNRFSSGLRDWVWNVTSPGTAVGGMVDLGRLLNSTRGRDLDADARPRRGRAARRRMRASSARRSARVGRARVPRVRPGDRRRTPATGSPRPSSASTAPRARCPGGWRRWRSPRSRPDGCAAPFARTSWTRSTFRSPSCCLRWTRRRRPRPSSTSSTRCFPEFFSRAELAYRRRVYGWTVRKSRIVITISEHARQALVERLRLDPGRVRAIHLAVDHERFTPDGRRAASRSCSTPRTPGRTRTTSGCSRRSREVRRERPELRLVLTGAGHDRPDPARRRRVARPRDPRRARRPLPQRRRARLPEPLRGLRDPLRRGDGMRLPGGRLERRLDPRGLRRRRRLLRPARPGIDRRGDPRRPRPTAARRNRAGRPVHLGRCARRHDEVYEELAATV